ncbi:MAG: enoyl-CoA hydratase/isomerase family protein [Candidatus Freyarchaeota archaeon]
MKRYEQIKYEELDGGISIIKLNRPEKLNAITIQMIEELHDLFNRLEWDLDVRVLILTGEGQGFSAGTDLNEAANIYTPEVPENYRHLKYMDIPESQRGGTTPRSVHPNSFSGCGISLNLSYAPSRVRRWVWASRSHWQQTLD